MFRFFRFVLLTALPLFGHNIRWLKPQKSIFTFAIPFFPVDFRCSVFHIFYVLFLILLFCSFLLVFYFAVALNAYFSVWVLLSLLSNSCQPQLAVGFTVAHICIHIRIEFPLNWLNCVNTFRFVSRWFLHWIRFGYLHFSYPFCLFCIFISGLHFQLVRRKFPVSLFLNLSLPLFLALWNFNLLCNGQFVFSHSYSVNIKKQSDMWN